MPTLYDTPVYYDPRIFVAPTIANLRLTSGPVPSPTAAAASGSPSYAIAVLLGGTTAFDGTDGLYAWDETSITADNGTTVIRPTSIPIQTAGRWRQIV